jgi:hypothetical protein
MTWFWSDDLARLLIEHDAAPPASVARWITSPRAFRGDGDALEFARRLMAAETEDDAATTAA